MTNNKTCSHKDCNEEATHTFVGVEYCGSHFIWKLTGVFIVSTVVILALWFYPFSTPDETPETKETYTTKMVGNEIKR